MSSLPPPPARLDPAFVDDATVIADSVSVWFGQKVAISELSCSFGPGVTGLLGPNGAGKTTLMRGITGLLSVNQGSVAVNGLDPRRDRRVYDGLALVPEDEAVPLGLTPRQLCAYVADLHRIAEPHVVERALDTVELLAVADRSMDGFSKGMRQRSKVAAALVKDPAVLVLDEPLNGADPIQRLHLIDLFQRLGDEGRTIIVSSHVLHEVESMADRVIVMVRGRLAAAGSHRAIRNAMDDVPRQVLVKTEADGRRLGAALLKIDAVRGVTVQDEHIVISTMRARDLSVALPRAARDLGIRLTEVRPLDDSLESLFRELVR
ncbi:MAG: ABC transporter ATP-binding protein [Acidimicrobiales bacterium]|nr:ABC transporter ATP-binding protein [Acidimicrobiales bacterium]